MILTNSYSTFFPQFCREAVNDHAWYPGFTDWDLIKRVSAGSRDRFTPKVGYYDLSVNSTISREFDSLSTSKWPGMALYHYYFDGQHVLDSVERFIVDGGNNVPSFFTIWANESWTKRWVGQPREIIIAQRHSIDRSTVTKHVQRLGSLMQHSAYKRINGRPLFVIYSAYEIPNIERFLDVYRTEFQRQGITPAIGFCVSYIDDLFPAQFFDFCLEFQPRLFFNTIRKTQHAAASRIGLLIKRHVPGLYDELTNIRDSIYRYRNRPRNYLSYRDYLSLASSDVFGSLLTDSFGIPVIRSTFYSWNNFPRYRGSALAVTHADSDYQRFNALCDSLAASNEWFMVNSWNEWSEGAALEPGLIHPEQFERD